MGGSTRHRSKLWTAAGIALPLAVGCGSSSAGPPGYNDHPLDGGSHVDASDASDVVQNVDAVIPGDAHSTSFGDLVILDVPDVPCVPASAPALLLSEGLMTASGFEKLGQLGDRRFAFGVEGSVAVTFGYDGASPSGSILGPLAVTAQNGALEALVAMGDNLGVQFYDASGKAQGAALALNGSMISGPSLGAGPTASLAVWCTPDDVSGLLLDQSRMPGAMLTLFPGASGDGACRTATEWNGMNFTVVWTRRLSDGSTKTSIGFVDLDGTLNFGKQLVHSSGVHELVDIALAPWGYVILLAEGEGSGNPVVVRVDPYGNVLPPGLRLKGSRQSFSLATFRSEFAIAAMLADGRAAMRPFDANGNVLGPWVCVDDRAPEMLFAGRAAVGTDDRGYAVVARMNDGSNWYMRTDHLGDGVPESD